MTLGERMPLTMIKGQYRIVGAAPDGDSIRFYPDDPAAFNKANIRVHANKAGGVQLRLDAIDALETHYRPTLGGLSVQHQPAPFADDASTELLRFLGFSNVVRGADQVVTSARPDAVSGHILTRFGDKYGRAVAFAFKGSSRRADGSQITLDAALTRQSANYNLLERGLAYPTYYSKLFPDIRQELTKAVQGARKAGRGLWPSDVTTQGFRLKNLATITDSAVILPKLFRRLLDYLALNDGDASLAGFKAYLASRNDRLFILSTGHVTGFDFVVEVNAQMVRLTNPPEDLVFQEG